MNLIITLWTPNRESIFYLYYTHPQTLVNLFLPSLGLEVPFGTAKSMDFNTIRTKF